jgi:hypothetical protein
LDQRKRRILREETTITYDEKRGFFFLPLKLEKERKGGWSFPLAYQGRMVVILDVVNCQLQVP